MHHNRRVFVRLLTAIPLLFWASTAAMAQLAVLWATQPAAAAVAQSAPNDDDFALTETAGSPHGSEFLTPHLAFTAVPDAQMTTGPSAPAQAQPRVPQTVRILAASRLLANPPPAGV
jgi:hypothetical protein